MVRKYYLAESNLDVDLREEPYRNELIRVFKDVFDPVNNSIKIYANHFEIYGMISRSAAIKMGKRLAKTEAFAHLVTPVRIRGVENLRLFVSDAFSETNGKWNRY